MRAINLLKHEINAPTKVLYLVALIFIAGCGGGKTDDNLIPPDAPSAQALAQTSNTTSTGSVASALDSLEKSGSVLKQDRSSSLTGPDSNKNGIRDDIDQYIRSNYKNTEEIEAAERLARSIAAVLIVDQTNPEKMQNVSQEMGNSVDCAVLKIKRYSDLINKLEALTFNTKGRAQVYIAYNKARSGTSTSMSSSDKCVPIGSTS